MKISDIPKGTKILVPCVRCGYKRSITFQNVAAYQVQKTRLCHTCGREDVDYGGRFLNHYRGKKGGSPSLEDMG